MSLQFINSSLSTSSTQEQIVHVSSDGTFLGKIQEKGRNETTIIAASLALIYLPQEKRLLLLKRSTEAEDMQSTWALPSGKVNESDLSPTECFGRHLSLVTFKNALIRELREELNFQVDHNRLILLDKFLLEEKKLFIALFGIKLQKTEKEIFAPTDIEVETYRFFSLEELKQERKLGHALSFKKSQIIEFLSSQFSNSNGEKHC